MKQKIILLLWLSIPLFCMAQMNLIRQYEYDAAGNRTSRKVIQITPPELTPPSPPLEGHTQYFVEKIAQVEIKIYPNPTTENITLEIAGWKELQTGVFKLYALTGQLLQEQPVHSVTTTVSLAGLPKGTYILKVHINNRTENWKVIKN